MQVQIAELLPEREGHFVFESGHHGRVWLDLELLLLRPERVQPLAETLAGGLRRYRPEAICGPLVEGAFVGLLVASSLRLPFAYSQPTRDDRRARLFPVSYPIPKPLQAKLRGKRVALVNDVINAGSAVRGTLAALEQCDAKPVAIGTLAVYGEAASKLAASRAVPLETLASFPSQVWEPSACPLCARGVPLTGEPPAVRSDPVPGSRGPRGNSTLS
jgi:orotate phosphoribosyltransferase